MNGLPLLLKVLAADKVLAAARRHAAWYLVLVFAVLAGCWLYFRPFREPSTLVNVAYDASREYFKAIDAAFAAPSPMGAGMVLTSHAGSVKQARALAEGMVAEVVCLATAYDLDIIAAKTGCLNPDWRERFPYGSSPFTSTIVLVVKKGNPRAIEDWSSLHRRPVASLIPSPGTSGAGVYAFLSAFRDALLRNGGNDLMAIREVSELYLRADMPELGASQLTEMFLRRKQADVLVTWESEAIRITRHLRPGEYETIYPSVNLMVEPVVTLFDCHVEERGNRETAVRYLEFLFSQRGQEIAASVGLRPRLASVAEAGIQDFPPLTLVRIEEAFGEWKELQKIHFGPNGTFERIQLLRSARTGGVE